jgi:hypothetical protein
MRPNFPLPLWARTIKGTKKFLRPSTGTAIRLFKHEPKRRRVFEALSWGVPLSFDAWQVQRTDATFAPYPSTSHCSVGRG